MIIAPPYVLTYALPNS